MKHNRLFTGLLGLVMGITLGYGSIALVAASRAMLAPARPEPTLRYEVESFAALGTDDGGSGSGQKIRVSDGTVIFMDSIWYPSETQARRAVDTELRTAAVIVDHQITERGDGGTPEEMWIVVRCGADGSDTIRLYLGGSVVDSITAPSEDALHMYERALKAHRVEGLAYLDARPN